MAWDETTNFRHAGFKTLCAFRLYGNTGCVLLFKPFFLILGIGFEKWDGGGGLYIGPFAAGFGPIDNEENTPC